MASARTPGPEGLDRPVQIDDGTMCRQPSPKPGPVRSDLSQPRIAFAMSPAEKLTEAISRARRHLSPEVAQKLLALMTPEAIAVIGSVATLWTAGHFFGISEIVDVVLLGLGVYALGSDAMAAGHELAGFVTVALNSESYSDLDRAGQHLARFVAIVGVDAAIAVLLHKASGETIEDKASTPGGGAPRLVNLTAELKVELRPDISLPGAGRSGENVKFLTGPPNSAVKSKAPGRVFITNAKGQVILDITLERVKEVQPQVGFVGEKRQTLTVQERDLIKLLWNQ
jgi:hypothetical protein